MKKQHALVAFEDLDSDLDKPEESDQNEGSNNLILIKPNLLKDASSRNSQVQDFNLQNEDNMLAPR